MTLEKPYYLTEQGYKNLIKLQAQYEKVIEQNRQLQQELREKTAECEKYKQVLDEIEKIIQMAPNTTFPHQCDMNSILDVINKAKDGEE